MTKVEFNLGIELVDISLLGFLFGLVIRMASLIVHCCNTTRPEMVLAR